MTETLSNWGLSPDMALWALLLFATFLGVIWVSHFIQLAVHKRRRMKEIDAFFAALDLVTVPKRTEDFTVEEIVGELALIDAEEAKRKDRGLKGLRSREKK